MTNFFKQNKILITGHNGFLGRNLVPMLIKHKANLILPGKEDCNLLNYNQLNETIKRYNPNIIIHLAALAGGIGANRQRPYSFLYDNVLMNANVVQAAIANRIDKLVTIGSVCSYPKFASVLFNENELWNGYPEETNAPYGESKRVLLLLCQTARQQHGLNAIHLIPTNMYGKYDNFDPETSHVIPALIQKVKQAEQSLTVWGTGAATRDFLYVEDCCQAIIKATESYNGNEPINLGSGKEVSIKELVVRLASIMAYEGSIVWDRNKPDGQPRRCLNIDRAKKYLDWQPTTELEDGLNKVIGWWRFSP